MKAKYFTAAAMLGLMAVFSGPALADGMFKRCAEDIDFYCGDVEPGDGRVLACLYANTATLSEDCYAATDGIGRLLEGFFDKLASVNAACAGDIKSYCAGAESGGGYMFQCLRDNKTKISEACAAELPLVTAQPDS